jgi:hypothetical protein
MNNNEIIVNPFLNLLNFESTSIDKLYEEYKYVYIICLKPNEHIDNEIYKYNINKIKFNEIKKKLILLRVNINIISNYNHKNNLISLSSTTIEEINIFNYVLTKKIIGLLILNIDYENILLYISQYETNTNLEQLFKLITLNMYFNDNNNKTYKQISKLLDFEDSNYWTYSYKCKIDLTKYFINRKFNLSNTLLKDIGCYLKDIYKTKNYIDPSKLLLSGNFKYMVFNEKIITKDDINNLFDILDEKQKYLLFCNLIVSKRYCHLALNNIYLLRLMKDTLKEYAELFRYIIGYAWMKFYFDESIKKTFITKNDDFIFDINTASELPNYPFLISNPKLNPYMPILINDEEFCPKNNIGSIPDYCDRSLSNPICNLEEFKDRLNIFCTNSSKNNIFEHINFQQDNIAITGSVMSACLQKKHPLINLFNIKSNDEQLARFYNEYYALADIDIMFLTEDIFDYMSKVQKFYCQIVVNMCNLYPTYAEPRHFKLVSEKTGYLFIHETKALRMLNNSYKKLEEVKKSIEEPETKKIFESLFLLELEKFQKERLSKMTHEELDHFSVIYPDYFNFNNLNWRIRFINDEFNKDSNFLINYKYQIKSPHLNHNLELFNVKYNDFFATVSTFHLPCVRSYYDGNNVYLTPSCISAHLTYMNIDYKYFSGSKDPIDIINKYRMRGFGTWLNHNEKIIFTKYSKYNIFWNKLYEIKSELNNNNIYGFLSMNHKLFHPRIYNLDSFNEAFPIDWLEPYIIQKEPKVLSNVNEYFIELSKRYNITLSFPFLSDMQVIGFNGKIRKLNKWVIETCWNIIESKKYKETIVSKPIIINKNKNYDISSCYIMNNDITNQNKLLQENNKITQQNIKITNPSITLSIDNKQKINNDVSYTDPSYADPSYADPSYNTSYADPSYNTSYADPSYITSYANPSYNTSYADPSYITSYANPSYNTSYNDPDYYNDTGEPNINDL